MTPLQQLLLVSILPLSFLGMLVYLWLRSSKRRQVLYRWSFVLLAAAVWASSVLRFYGDGRFSPVLIFNWSIVGAYAFSLAALGVLLTTKRYMFVAARPGNTALVISLILWSGALALDPLSSGAWSGRLLCWPDSLCASSTCGPGSGLPVGLCPWWPPQCSPAR
jgi:hypothetical protein